MPMRWSQPGPVAELMIGFKKYSKETWRVLCLGSRRRCYRYGGNDADANLCGISFSIVRKEWCRHEG